MYSHSNPHNVLHAHDDGDFHVHDSDHGGGIHDVRVAIHDVRAVLRDDHGGRRNDYHARCVRQCFVMNKHDHGHGRGHPEALR